MGCIRPGMEREEKSMIRGRVDDTVGWTGTNYRTKTVRVKVETRLHECTLGEGGLKMYSLRYNKVQSGVYKGRLTSEETSRLHFIRDVTRNKKPSLIVVDFDGE